jgi:outer membrane protein assembly factor BamE (lipoprotein component of BamABCDE complex)
MKKGHFIAWTTMLAVVALLLEAGCSKPMEYKPPSLDVVAPNVSVGKVRKGMTRQEVEDAIGKPGKKDSATSYYKGMWVLFNTNGVIFNIKCVKGFAGHTQESIGIGSTRDEVIQAYGKPDEEKPYDHGDVNLWYSALNTTFWVQRGKVTSFIVHF